MNRSAPIRLPAPIARPPWSAELFEAVTDLLAEALFQDFQEHRRATVESPQGTNRKISLTNVENETK